MPPMPLSDLEFSRVPKNAACVCECVVCIRMRENACECIKVCCEAARVYENVSWLKVRACL